jgi:hypothetical protein
MRRINKEQAHAAYDILTQHIGAHEGKDGAERERFVLQVADLFRPVATFRLTSLLGPNGQFHNDGGQGDVPHASCPTDEMTPDREAMLDAVNLALFSLFGQAKRRRFGTG